ncbi:hypothetical protein BDK51DRAFT_41546 [Blyttiomyces helicus]|uniref:Uncharacterized protein n=1 Tax=Blyttiomyces helicus TaxID=388810 RepID=A0A4P9WL95_9FUNG|nr:hypothetical protein BDK51DRAFT_41546 [Blyttiomyces helicus]|eukprot:RKO93811.1 hypothetical protein BDK51DRAFT_41546 [Blyttiomyces helicus]
MDDAGAEVLERQRSPHLSSYRSASPVPKTRHSGDTRLPQKRMPKYITPKRFDNDGITVGVSGSRPFRDIEWWIADIPMTANDGLW